MVVMEAVVLHGKEEEEKRLSTTETLLNTVGITLAPTRCCTLGEPRVVPEVVMTAQPMS